MIKFQMFPFNNSKLVVHVTYLLHNEHHREEAATNVISNNVSSQSEDVNI